MAKKSIQTDKTSKVVRSTKPVDPTCVAMNLIYRTVPATIAAGVVGMLTAFRLYVIKL